MLLPSRSIGGGLLGVSGISLVLGSLLGGVTLVDAGGLVGSLLVGGLHGSSDGSAGSGGSGLVASELGSEGLLGLLGSSVESLLVGSVLGGKRLHGGLVLVVDASLVLLELGVGSLHGLGNGLGLGVTGGDGLSVGSHLLLVLGETTARGSLGGSGLVGHGLLDTLHLLLESGVLLHQLLLGNSGLVHLLDGLGSVGHECLASGLDTTLHGLGSSTLLLVQGTSLGTETGLLLGPLLLNSGSSSGGLTVGASGSLSVLGGLVAHDSLDETLVELAGLGVSGLVGSVVGLVGSGVLGLDLLKAGLLEEDATIVTRRHTGGEGLHHGADGASATVRLEATVSAGVLVHGHGSDLHLEHGDVVREANVLRVAACGAPREERVEALLATVATNIDDTLGTTLSLGLLTGTVGVTGLGGGLASSIGLGTRLGREGWLNASPSETCILLLSGLGLGARHKVIAHERTLRGGLVALAVLGLALGTVNGALLDLLIGSLRGLGLLLVGLGVLLRGLLGGLLLGGGTVGLGLLLASLLHVLLERGVSLGGDLSELLRSGGTRLLEGSSIGGGLLGVSGISLVLGSLLGGVTLVD